MQKRFKGSVNDDLPLTGTVYQPGVKVSHMAPYFFCLCAMNIVNDPSIILSVISRTLSLASSAVLKP